MAEAALRAAPAPAAGEAFALGVENSFSGRAWRLRGHDPEIARQLALMGAGAELAKLLAARGLTGETMAAFLEPRLKTELPDPCTLARMAAAAERFADAVAAGETIAVFGDYDVDGAASAAQIVCYLRALGRAALLYVPDRLTEGYGPSRAALAGLRAQGASLVVTVDCGATAHDAFGGAEAGDVIVLDHHATETHPPVFAHVNPNGPDDSSGLHQLCAAGLTFLFLVAVQRVLRARCWFAGAGVAEPDLFALLDLVALATIADVVPLTGVNRAFVRQGLRRLEALERPGLAALARLARAAPPFSPYHLGFVFGPRINAGGRVGACDLGARLLSTEDGAQAEALALELDTHNRERQAIEAGIVEHAFAAAAAAAHAGDPFLLMAGDFWHAGVVGIVAGRLKERFGKPALVTGFDSDGADALARGSARSVAGVDIGAIIRAARAAGHLESGGGHAMAAGFSLKRARLEGFRAFLAERLAPMGADILSAPVLMADALLSAAGATPALLGDLERAGPFGSGNPEPLFLLPDLTVAYAGIVGGQHVRLRLAGADGASLGAILFRAADTVLGRALLKARGRRIHAAGRLKRDDYGGTVKAQLHLEDAAPADL